MPAVSVIVPLYNKESYVARSLASIAAQTMRDFEVLVVDDGSTDDGAKIAEDFPDARIRILRQANAGPGAARNRGLHEAVGEYVAFLDADDEWLPEYLQRSVARLKAYGPRVASITSGYYEWPRIIDRRSYWRRRGIAEGVVRLSPDTDTKRMLSTLAYMSSWSTVARTEIVRKWGGFYDRDRCRYAEDAYLWLKLLLNETVAFQLEPLVRFHVEASALSRNLKGARPVEPFLAEAEGIEAACPDEMRELLARFLAARAFKTACVLGYWGRWRESQALFRRFVPRRAWRLPYFWPALVCATPLAGPLGSAHRWLWGAGAALRPAPQAASVRE